MDPSDVKERVAVIEDMMGDFEAAHGAEDSLFEDVLRAIANGTNKPKELAAEALKSKLIDFGRHCA